MVAYVIRRLLYSIPVLIATSFIVFSFVAITADPLGNLRMNRNASQATIQKVIEEKHLEEPTVVRYGYWVKDAVTNQFGSTLLGERPILPDLKRVLGNTLQLLIAAELLALILGISVGVYSAIRQYSAFDYTATGLSFLGIALPVFWLALMLQVLFTQIYLNFDLRIFYTAQLSSAEPGSGLSFVIDRIQHLAIPVFVIAVLNIATYSRFLRASMLEVLNSDYVRTARAKGLKETPVVMRHAFRNALIPLVTLAALNFGGLFGGVIVTETIFALDGMGFYFINALGAGDPYPIMAWLMVTSTMLILANLAADILLGIVDPRIRYE
jgi:peptide/nickel transport system permease protein